MARIDPNLQRMLRDMRDESSSTSGDQVTIVTVKYTGDVGALRKAGLTVMGDAGGIAIGDIRLDQVEALAALDNVLEVTTQPRLRLHLDTSVPEIHADVLRTGVPPYTGSGVIVGIVDTGIDILHKCFIKADGKTTRILSIWDQTLVAAAGEKPPAGFTFGVEFTAAQINAAIQASNEAFRHQDVNGHGSHVAGIAAGNGSQSGNCHGQFKYRGVAPDADLVIVKGLADPNSANQQTNISLAVDYILGVAAAPPPGKPVVVNLSLGHAVGAHDGTDASEVHFDALLTGSTGRAIVISAGNDGAIGSADDIANGDYRRGVHTSGTIAANASSPPIKFFIPPKDKTPDFMDLRYSTAGRLQITVTEPGGASIGPIAPAASAGAATPIAGNLLTVDSELLAGARNYISLTLAPPAGGAITSGYWTVVLKETSGNPVDYDFWINSSHSDPYPVFEFSQRNNARTVGMPGTAKNVITVASYGSEDGGLADSSSRGPTLAADNRQKPDIAAPGLETAPVSGIVSVKSKARGVFFCCDCCVDFYVDLSGTSMSAPHVTGVVALMLQKKPTLTFDQIRKKLQTSARAPGGAVATPNNDWGFGKIDAKAAVDDPLPGPGGGGGFITDQPRPFATPIERLEMSPVVHDAGAASAPESDAKTSTEWRIANRLRDMISRTSDNPTAQLIAALVSTHIDEVYQLIHSNRRVATMWHRMSGPILMRSALIGSEPSAHRPLIPVEVDGSKTSEPLGRLLALLCRYGSKRLRDDVSTYGPLMLALLGTTLSDLRNLSFVAPQRATAVGDGFASWNP